MANRPSKRNAKKKASKPPATQATSDKGFVTIRAQDGVLRLHEGGESFITLPATAWTKEQISPTRDTRLRWMQSVIGCTHYVTGAGEQAYLHQDEAPDIAFVRRDEIENSDEAYTELPP